MVVTTTRKNCGFARHSPFHGARQNSGATGLSRRLERYHRSGPETELMGSPITFDKLRNLFFPLQSM
jgi:hypothetical protein